MKTEIKNMLAHLVVGSVSPQMKTVTFDYVDAEGETISAYSDANNIRSSQISAHYEGDGFAPNDIIPVVCDICYTEDFGDSSAIEFLKLHILETSTEKAGLDLIFNGEFKPITFSESYLQDLIEGTRKHRPDCIAVVAFGEEACRAIVNEDFDNGELQDNLREIIFTNIQLKDAYLSGLEDAVGYLEVHSLDNDQLKQLNDTSNKRSGHGI